MISRVNVELKTNVSGIFSFRGNFDIDPDEGGVGDIWNIGF
jgi:hypothetical protein